jgi:hypothetical protein
MQIEEHDDIQHRLADDLTTLTGRTVTKEDVFWALFILYEKECDLEWAGDLWDVEISYEESMARLSNFDFKALDSFIELPDILFPESLFMLKKVRVKAKGRIWHVHRYDPDPFPSNPHAHNLDENIKLHLGTGDCYRCGQIIDKVGKKELLVIRAELDKKMMGPLPALELD